MSVNSVVSQEILNQKSNPAEIRRAMDIIMDDGMTHEIRTIGRNFVGFFNDREKADEKYNTARQREQE
jgi:hypothetical protein